jgi:hypothetical protein
MIRLILTIMICLGMINHLNAKKKYNWSIPTGKIISVFENNSKKDQVELLRLYKSGEYENLLYITQKNKPELVKRNLGTYELKKRKLILNKPFFEEFKGRVKIGKVYFINQDLYENRIDCFLKLKKSKFIKQTKKNFKKPFYICLNSDEIVSNDSIERAFKLSDLVNYIVKDSKNDRDKTLSITKFICQSIEYDYNGYYYNKYAHSQSDIYSILASKNRIAVCAGYSYVFDSLARIAKLTTRQVIGYTKQDYNDYGKLAGLHAWNIVELDGKEFYIDVTWADGKKSIDMKWMFTDPEIMLLSHYPLNEKDNLFNKSFTSNKFKYREVVLPTIESAKIKHYPIQGVCRTESNKLKVKFSEKVNVTAFWIDPEIKITEYIQEKSTRKLKQYDFNEIDSIKSYFLKDTFCIEIPIKNKEVAMYIDVDGQYVIKTSVFNGGEKEFLLTKIGAWNNYHAYAFVEGILAAIKLGNYQFLKDKLGEKYDILFDKKGKWKLSQSLYSSILNWDGVVQGIDGIDHYSYENGKFVLHKERFVKFNSENKIYYNFENQKYEFLKIN